MFVARDIVAALKYDDKDQAVRKHVNHNYKRTYRQLVENDLDRAKIDPRYQPRRFDGVTQVGQSNIDNGSSEEFNKTETGVDRTDYGTTAKPGSPLYLHPITMMVSKSGVIQLIMKSKLPYAVELQEWLLEEVIPQVLSTGKYATAIQDETQALCLYKDLQSIVQKKDEQLQHLNKQLQKMSEQKDQVIHRIMNDMNRMYTGFQNTMQRKDEMMALKDEQVSKMIDKMVDLSDRAVQYPANEKKLPMICIAKNGTTFEAITGQRPYVEQQKHKRSFDQANIIVEEKRPNPVVDWNNAMHEASLTFSKDHVKRLKRSVYFDVPEDADKFKNMLQQMLVNNRTLLLK
ncbi:BRO-D [Mythimna sequax nucleopolyhedrovirus]|nr:BRO-D [Mythimna sequax nucleopolyhedrovirus]